MRRLGFLLAVLTLVIFLNVVLVPRPPIVNRGAAQYMGHPITRVGKIFRSH